MRSISFDVDLAKGIDSGNHDNWFMVSLGGEMYSDLWVEDVTVTSAIRSAVIPTNAAIVAVG